MMKTGIRPNARVRRLARRAGLKIRGPMPGGGILVLITPPAPQGGREPPPGGARGT